MAIKIKGSTVIDDSENLIVEGSAQIGEQPYPTVIDENGIVTTEIQLRTSASSNSTKSIKYNPSRGIEFSHSVTPSGTYNLGHSSL